MIERKLMASVALIALALCLPSTARGDTAQWVSVDFRDGSQRSGWVVAKRMMQSCKDKKYYSYAPPDDHAVTLNASPCDNPSHTITGIASMRLLLLVPSPTISEGQRVDPGAIDGTVSSQTLRTFLAAQKNAQFQVVDPKTGATLSSSEVNRALRTYNVRLTKVASSTGATPG